MTCSVYGIYEEFAADFTLEVNDVSHVLVL